MKKRLISLLVALCMAVTLLPVSAITAWAEEGGSKETFTNSVWLSGSRC